MDNFLEYMNKMEDKLDIFIKYMNEEVIDLSEHKSSDCIDLSNHYCHSEDEYPMPVFISKEI